MSDSSSCNHFNFNDPSKEVITNGVRTETNLHNQRHRSSTVDGSEAIKQLFWNRESRAEQTEFYYSREMDVKCC